MEPSRVAADNGEGVSVKPDGIALGQAITPRKAEVERVTLQGGTAPPNAWR